MSNRGFGRSAGASTYVASARLHANAPVSLNKMLAPDLEQI
jgi:hypothetical protein